MGSINSWKTHVWTDGQNILASPTVSNFLTLLYLQLHCCQNLSFLTSLALDSFIEYWYYNFCSEVYCSILFLVVWNALNIIFVVIIFNYFYDWIFRFKFATVVAIMLFFIHWSVYLGAKSMKCNALPIHYCWRVTAFRKLIYCDKIDKS